MNTIETLAAIKAVIDTPDKWTKRAFAASADDLPCLESSSFATRRCLLGAYRYIRTTYPNTSKEIKTYSRILDAIKVYTGQTEHGMVMFNDDENTTHRDVMTVLDLAMAMRPWWKRWLGIR